jgi:hypothetical protein
MAFELFAPPKARTSRIPKLKRSDTVMYSAKMGKLSIRKTIYEEYLKSDYIKIYCDKKAGKIALEATTEVDPNAIKILGKKSKYITIKKFVDHFGIDLIEKVNLPVEVEDNMVIFNIA